MPRRFSASKSSHVSGRPADGISNAQGRAPYTVCTAQSGSSCAVSGVGVRQLQRHVVLAVRIPTDDAENAFGRSVVSYPFLVTYRVAAKRNRIVPNDFALTVKGELAEPFRQDQAVADDDIACDWCGWRCGSADRLGAVCTVSGERQDASEQ